MGFKRGIRGLAQERRTQKKSPASGAVNSLSQIALKAKSSG